MSNLVEHARRELVRIGETPETISGILDVVQSFADMEHSGFSATHTVGVLEKLLMGKPLSPLTDDPTEWNLISSEMSGSSDGLWQNVRNPEAFSLNGGETYYVLSERDIDPTAFHKSVEVERLTDDGE
jgi:hypothetical protein